MNYKDKKLLVLGGAFQHSKVVDEAKKLGIYTIVTDNLEPSDALQSKSLMNTGC